MPQIPVGIRDRKKSVMHLFPQGMPNNVEKRETCKPTLQSNVKCCEQGTHRAPKSTSQDHLDRSLGCVLRGVNCGEQCDRVSSMGRIEGRKYKSR